MLCANQVNIINKLLGIKQQTFGYRCWDNICAVTSSATIDRDTMHKEISKQLVKTEFLVDKITDIMNLKNAVLSAVSLFESRAYFDKKELLNITTFLLYQGKQSNLVGDVEFDKKIDNKIKINPQLQCKSCGEKSNYSRQSGRYGYFIECNKCDVNTSMKIGCVQCKSLDNKVTKKKEIYTLICNVCDSFYQLFTP